MFVLQVVCSFLLYGVASGSYAWLNAPWQIVSCNQLPSKSPSGLYSMRLASGEVFTVYCEMGLNAPWQIVSCNQLPSKSPSGLYSMRLASGELFTVYCEMGLNGGGYTFIPRDVFSRLTVKDLNQVFKKKTDILLRISRPDGTQPYTVVSSLYNKAVLNLYLNTHDEGAPINKGTIGAPYLYLNTIPGRYMRHGSTGGFKSNGKRITYYNCDNSKRNQFTFFENPNERKPSSSHITNNVYERQGVAVEWRKSAIQPPSGSRMPLNFFLFTEMHFGGCGCYTSSDRWLNAPASPALGTAIGLR